MPHRRPTTSLRTNRSSRPFIRDERASGSSWQHCDPAELPQVGYFGGAPEIQATSLTGGSTPDFAFWTEGADTQWLYFVADTGGLWHTVGFDDWDFSSQPQVSLSIDAARIQGHLIDASTDDCGCAPGLVTFATFRYNGSAFVPTSPPGPAATCTPVAFTVLSHMDRMPAAFARASCLDGWAAAAGRDGTEDVVGLFEQYQKHWVLISRSNHLVSAFPGDSDSEGDVYAIPYTVLRSMASSIGEPVGQLLRGPPLRSALANF